MTHAYYKLHREVAAYSRKPGETQGSGEQMKFFHKAMTEKAERGGADDEHVY